jgi:hypothetical protein
LPDQVPLPPTEVVQVPVAERPPPVALVKVPFQVPENGSFVHVPETVAVSAPVELTVPVPSKLPRLGLFIVTKNSPLVVTLAVHVPDSLPV